MIITIDGPTASGKSTLARQLALSLGIYYLNSGYLYRGLAYILSKYFKYNEENFKKPDLVDIKNVLSNNEKFRYYFDGKNPYIYFNAEDITPFLKSSEIDKYSSIISSNSFVRNLLLNYQREFAKTNNLITEGRDCGSVVFTNADIKFFLTASIEVRAKRWQQDMLKHSKNFSLEECVKIISDRDEKDKTRSISPLTVPKDAIVIDSSNLTTNELFDKCLSIIKQNI